MTSFVAQSLAFLCVFCFGLAEGSILIIFLPFKNKSKSARTVSASIFLTLCAIFYTILIFQTHSLFPLPQFLSEHVRLGFSRLSYYLLIFVIFFLGILISLFWKIALPVCVILYASFSWFTLYLLKSQFKNQDKHISVKIDKTLLSVGEKQIQKSADFYQFFVFEYCTIPDSLCIPIPRHYFKLKSIAEYKNPAISAENFVFNAVLPAPENEIAVSYDEDKPKILENSLVSAYLNTILLKKCVSSRPIPLPEEKIYPSIFSLNIAFIKNEFSATFERDL